MIKVLGPYRLVVGSVIGAIGGYFLHYASLDAYRRLAKIKTYKKKFAEEAAKGTKGFVPRGMERKDQQA